MGRNEMAIVLTILCNIGRYSVSLCTPEAKRKNVLLLESEYGISNGGGIVFPFGSVA